MPHQTPHALLPKCLALLAGILLAANLTALGQSIGAEPPQSSGSGRSESQHLDAPHSFSSLEPMKPQTLEESYHAITPSQRMRWFVTGTVGPAHLAGVGFVSACGTAVNRPGEYGPHWAGFANRFGMSEAGSALGNVVEASSGMLLREDPRYFRLPHGSFKARVSNVVRLTFFGRDTAGRLGPAYARFLGIVGSNFISNTWRVGSEANTQDPLLRSTEGFAGRMAANAFAEFWPVVRKYVFRKRNRVY